MALISNAIVNLNALNQLVNLLSVVMLSVNVLCRPTKWLFLDSDALMVTIFTRENSPLIVDEHALLELACYQFEFLYKFIALIII